eukprot:symbB.v1.2.012669.t4/scaffold881.1/size155427/8
MAARISQMARPGVAPVEYTDGARVEMKVNKLTSVKTQLPYDYYTPWNPVSSCFMRLPFCKPVSVVKSVENLGEILAGDVIENSPYDLRMGDNQNCKLLCKQELKQADKDQFRARIDDEYLVNLIVDNLPAATKYIRRSDGKDYIHFSDASNISTKRWNPHGVSVTEALPGSNCVVMRKVADARGDGVALPEAVTECLARHHRELQRDLSNWIAECDLQVLPAPLTVPTLSTPITDFGEVCRIQARRILGP